MKLRKLSITILALCVMIVASAQSNKEIIKEIETHYGGFYKHKKAFDKKKWAMTKMQIAYKITTSQVSKAMDKNDYGKVKSSSGSYAILKGVNEEELQNITDKVFQNFIARMKAELGIEIVTWSSFKDSKNAEKLKEVAEDPEMYSKSQGLVLTQSYDGTPIWNKIIQITPGGKKLSKELAANHANLSMIVEFAAPKAEASAFIESSSRPFSDWVTISWGEEADQSITPVLGVRTNLGSATSFEKGLLANTSMGVATEVLHSWYMTATNWGNLERLSSDLPYATKIEELAGEVPEILQNRRNNKIEYVKTFVVETTPEKFEAAVMNATNKYFDDIIAYYNATKPG